VQGRVVSWRYLPAIAEPPPTTAKLGGLLRALHNQPFPPQPPGPLTDPFASVATAVAGTSHAIGDADRRWLTGRISTLRHQWAHLAFPGRRG